MVCICLSLSCSLETFTAWQASHSVTHFSLSAYICGHQYLSLSLFHVLVCPKCPLVYGESWHLRSTSTLNAGSTTNCKHVSSLYPPLVGHHMWYNTPLFITHLSA